MFILSSSYYCFCRTATTFLIPSTECPQYRWSVSVVSAALRAVVPGGVRWCRPQYLFQNSYVLLIQYHFFVLLILIFIYY